MVTGPLLTGQLTSDNARTPHIAPVSTPPSSTRGRSYLQHVASLTAACLSSTFAWHGRWRARLYFVHPIAVEPRSQRTKNKASVRCCPSTRIERCSSERDPAPVSQRTNAGAIGLGSACVFACNLGADSGSNETRQPPPLHLPLSRPRFCLSKQFPSSTEVG